MKFTPAEALKLLQNHYTESKISLSGISSLQDNGDGSQSPIFDIIDFKDDPEGVLIRVQDYCDPDYSNPDYTENDWTEARDRCNCWSKAGNAVEVNKLIDTILQQICL